MNTDDYAIVIGIQRYPILGPPHPPGGPNNLAGPSLDATAVDAWLADPAGGGVLDENRYLITSDMFPDPFHTQTVAGRQQLLAKPTAEELAGCFGWLIDRFKEANTLKLGRRLYVYFSGHGFGVDDCDGGIYTANANAGIRHHFYVRSWFDWFYRNAYFEEFVLWMDACSNPIPIGGPPSIAPLADRQVAGMAAGRRFVAFAAKYPLKSVERVMPDGQVRGVFTYTLLQGLKGAAADPATGLVSSESLRRYLKGSLSSFLPQQDRDNPDIGNKPSFGPVDNIDFGQATPKNFSRAIKFDNRHAGRRAIILDGDLQTVDQTVAGANTWDVSLRPGLYKLEVEPSTAQFLEINGESSDDVIVA